MFALVYSLLLLPSYSFRSIDLIDKIFNKANQIKNNEKMLSIFSELDADYQTNLYANDSLLLSDLLFSNYDDEIMYDLQQYQSNKPDYSSFDSFDDLELLDVNSNWQLLKFFVENLAHSCKLLIFILFSKHFKIFFIKKQKSKASKVVSTLKNEDEIAREKSSRISNCKFNQEV
jgi:hypothetical protein